MKPSFPFISSSSTHRTCSMSSKPFPPLPYHNIWLFFPYYQFGAPLSPTLSEWVKFAQSCPTLCGPMYYTVHGILQARILEWVAFPFSRASSQPRDQTQVSHIAGRFFISWATREALVASHSGELYSDIDPFRSIFHNCFLFSFPSFYVFLESYFPPCIHRSPSSVPKIGSRSMGSD